MAERAPRSYRFDLGDSDDGPIGLVIRITATTAQEAVARLEALLPAYVDIGDRLAGPLDRPAEYASLYRGEQAVTIDDLDADDIECTECEATIAEDQDRCPYEHEHPREEDGDEQPEAAMYPRT